MLALPKPAHACTCASSGSPKEALGEADAVFAGRVVALHTPGPSFRNGEWVISSGDLVTVEFKVNRVWKGPRRETLTVETERFGASCGFEFKEGRKYIVYTWDVSRTGLCTRTGPTRMAFVDLAALGKGWRPDAAISTVEPEIPTPEISPNAVPSGSSCGLTAHPDRHQPDASALGLLAGLVWLGVLRRPRR